MKKYVFSIIALGFLFSSCDAQKKQVANNNATSNTVSTDKVTKDWKKILTPTQYYIMVEKGTERPFENPYFDNHEKGVYVSAATGDTLFTSEAKFESGTGWPSFFAAANKNKVSVATDDSHGMVRDEVVETSTGLHLGHLFNDGPKPTGMRYCINSGALIFKKAK